MLSPQSKRHLMFAWPRHGIKQNIIQTHSKNKRSLEHNENNTVRCSRSVGLVRIRKSCHVPAARAQRQYDYVIMRSFWVVCSSTCVCMRCRCSSILDMYICIFCIYIYWIHVYRQTQRHRREHLHRGAINRNNRWQKPRRNRIHERARADRAEMETPDAHTVSARVLSPTCQQHGD